MQSAFPPFGYPVRTIADQSFLEDAQTASGGVTEHVAPKKRRRQTPRSKTGCSTCRIRRVKCDEAKPHCVRCTGTGRKCDGYPEPTAEPESSLLTNLNLGRKKSSNHSTFLLDMSSFILRDSFLDFQGTTLEHRHLDFFYSQTAPSLSGHFDSQFWSVLVPQLACYEPSILHAMIALASLHEQSTFLLGKGADHEFTILQYNKAIKHLKAYQVSKENGPLTLLITCILFVCLEFMRGNINQALVHITSGSRILESLPLISAPGTASLASIQLNIAETFTRLNLQARMYGRNPPPVPAELLPITLDPLPDEPPTPFASFSEARYALNNIMESGVPRIHSAAALRFWPDEEVREPLIGKSSIVLAELERWNARMDISSNPANSTMPLEDPRTKVLLTAYRVCKIWFASAIYPEECAWDRQLPSFKAIVSLSKSIVGYPESPIKDSSSRADLPSASNEAPVWRDAFTFEMGIISTLYFTAIKCRNPIVRREAIELLGLTKPRREGLWDAIKAAIIAQRVMEIEEDGMVNVGIIAEDKRVHDAQWLAQPSESPELQKVVFILRRLDSDGQASWEFREEEITWQ